MDAVGNRTKMTTTGFARAYAAESDTLGLWHLDSAAFDVPEAEFASDDGTMLLYHLEEVGVLLEPLELDPARFGFRVQEKAVDDGPGPEGVLRRAREILRQGRDQLRGVLEVFRARRTHAGDELLRPGLEASRRCRRDGRECGRGSPERWPWSVLGRDARLGWRRGVLAEVAIDVAWCRHASEHDEKPWEYKLVPEGAISASADLRFVLGQAVRLG
jgi:hypothetical protein